MKTSYKILIGVGAVVLLYVLWELYCAWQDGKTDEPDISDSASEAASTVVSSAPAMSATSLSNPTAYVVKYGDRGDKVKTLQQYLNLSKIAPAALGGENLVEDSIFGPKTNKAIAFVDGLSFPGKGYLYTKNGDRFQFTQDQYDLFIGMLKETDRLNAQKANVSGTAYESNSGGGFFRPGMR